MFSIFKNIFPKKKLIQIDFSQIEGDMHSHLIPSIDDGSKSIEDSLVILDRFVNLGYSKVITTPHIMSDYYQNTPATILPAAKEIVQILTNFRLPFFYLTSGNQLTNLSTILVDKIYFVIFYGDRNL